MGSAGKAVMAGQRGPDRQAGQDRAGQAGRAYQICTSILQLLHSEIKVKPKVVTSLVFQIVFAILSEFYNSLVGTKVHG